MFWFARIIAPQAMNDLLADAVFLPNSGNDGIPTRSAAGVAWVGLASFPINGTQGYDCHERHASVLGNLRSIAHSRGAGCPPQATGPRRALRTLPGCPGGGVTCGQMLRSAPRCYHECPERAGGADSASLPSPDATGCDRPRRQSRYLISVTATPASSATWLPIDPSSWATRRVRLTCGW
jgi:hypothetical protein